MNNSFASLSKKRPNGYFYHLAIPYSVLAPWKADLEFQQVYEKVRKNTLVDYYKCYELWDLASQATALPGDYVEVGTWRGGSGALIASAASRLDKQTTVYLCDTFAGVPKAGKFDPHYKGGEYADTDLDSTRTFIESTMALSNVKILKGIFPEQTGDALKDKRFKFCHIDVDVYDSAKDVVDFLWDRLVVGGLIVFDDYGYLSTSGITKFVDEQRRKPARVVIHNLNGHGIIVKTG